MKQQLNILTSCVLLSFFLLSGINLHAQNTSNKGNDFWVGYMDHRDGTGSRMVLYMTSDSSTTGTVSVPGQNWSTNFSITANSMTLIDVPPTKAMVECTDCVVKKGIHVTSTKDIVVYSHVYHAARSDATLILPTRASGKEFYCMSYKQLSNGQYNQFMVVASQDSTKILITPSEDIKKSTGVHSKNKTYEITLNEGDVYQGQAVINGYGINADITGTHIQVIDTGKNSNCRTVSVFSGSTFTSLGCSGSGDNLYQQMFPISALGNTFVVVPFASRNGDLLRFLGTKNGTVVRVNGTNYPLSKGQFKEISVPSSGPLYIRSNYPIMMAQFQKTQSCGGGIGDPSMTILTPIEQTLEDIVLYSSSLQNITKNYINVVIPTSGRNSFTLDGNSITWQFVPSNTNYSYAQLSVNAGNHRLKASTGFSAIAYGFGVVESYGYVAGANIKKRDVFIEVANNSFQYDLGICDSNMVQFKAGGDTKSVASWEWDFGDGNKDTVENPKHLYKKPGDYKVRIKAFKGEDNSCSSYDSSEINLRVFAKPISGFQFEGNCINESILFKDTSSIDSGYILENNIWFLGDGKTKIASQFTYNYLDTGAFTVTNITISGDNCRDTSQHKIYINPIPNAKINWDKLCLNDTTNFIDSSSLSRGSIKEWQWLFNSNDTARYQNPKYASSKAGTNSLNLILTTDSLCITSWDTTFTVLDSILTNFQVKDTCSSIPLLYSNLSKTNSGLLTYEWTFGDDSSSLIKTPNHTYLIHGNYSVKLVTSQNGICKDSIMKNVEAFPSPIPSLEIRDTCFNQNTQFLSSYSLAKGIVTNTQWYINGKAVSKDSIHLEQLNRIGTHHSTLEITSNNGCMGRLKREFTIRDLPKPIIGPQTLNSVCELEAFTLYDSSLLSDSVAQSVWHFNKIKSVSNNFPYDTDTTGRITFKLVTKNIHGCVDSIAKTIDVYPLPDMDFDTGTYCAEELIPVSNNSTLQEGSIILWDWESNSLDLSSKKAPILSFSQFGNIPVKLIATTNRNCTDSILKNFTILAKPIAEQEIDTVCQGLATSFNSISYTPKGSIQSYLWDLGDGNKDTIAQFKHTYAIPGDYKVILEVISDKGCRDTNTKITHVADLPFAAFSSDLIQGCAPQNIEFTSESSIKNGNIVEWNWGFGDGNISSSEAPSNNYLEPGKYSISLKVKSQLNCTDSIIKLNHIAIHPKPILDFSYLPDTPSYLFPDIFLEDKSSSVLYEWIWLVNGSIIANWKETDYTFPDTGNYTLTLIGKDTNHCKDTITKNVFISPIVVLHIPNAFTPNDNSLNDVFKPEGIFLGITDYSFQVYNRWGELLFSSTDPEIGWDGKIENKTVQQGIYIYQIRYTDYLRTKWYESSGEIYILK